MNYKTKEDLEIASINLKEDFDMVISFIKTTKDLESMNIYLASITLENSFNKEMKDD